MVVSLRLPSLTSFFSPITTTTTTANSLRRRSPAFIRRSRSYRFQSQQPPPPPLAARFSSSQGTAAAETASEEQRVDSNAKSRVNPDRDRVITPRSQDFNAWYLDVIANAELADYGPVRGTMVIRPYGYAIWEAIQEYLNVRFKETGHSNMYFPQWVNVTRWEHRTKPFVRTLEFLWQEGHTAHATPEEAENEAMQMINVYTKFAYEQAAIPVIVGRKSRVETFAGASITYTIEAMMGDRKALQAGTSHNLGQNFSRAFETQFTDENGQRQHVWQTSWAISTRFVGGIIMTHGDDAGLMLPPRVAPIQVVIIPIWKKDDDKVGVLNAASSVKEVLQTAGVKVKLDDTDQRTPGWKFNFWEMKGVPLRIEIGPRDVSSGSVVISRRDIPGKQGKVFGISMEPSSLEAYVKDKLDEIQSALLEQATSFRDSNIVDVSSYDELKVAISQGKWARGPWSASDEDELKVKEETGATLRCFPFEQPQGNKTCLMTGNPAEEVAIFAKSY
nr:proline--trna ligase, chloroplastic/mitochondrial [Quercus suber]